MEDTTTGAQLFGMTNGNDGENGKRSKGYLALFRVKVDATSKDPSLTAADYHILKFSDMDEESFIMGMRPTMEYDAANSLYYIHCIYWKREKLIYYMRITPDDAADKAVSFKLLKEVNYGFESAWIGSTSGLIGDTNGKAFTGYESYSAVGIKKIEYA